MATIAPQPANANQQSDGSPFLPAQLAQLRAQINAYKSLSKNQPIPDALKAQAMGTSLTRPVPDNIAQLLAQSSQVQSAPVATVFSEMVATALPGTAVVAFSGALPTAVQPTAVTVSMSPLPKVAVVQQAAATASGGVATATHLPVTLPLPLLQHQPVQIQHHHLALSHHPAQQPQPQPHQQQAIIHQPIHALQTLPQQSQQQQQITTQQVSVSITQQQQQPALPVVHCLVPTERPPGLDPAELLKERELRMQSRIISRIGELERMSASVSDEAKTRLQIELRALRLLNFQRQLRQEVISTARRDSSLDTALNARAYKKPKKVALREARGTVRMELLRQMEAEKRQKQKHQEFLNAVLAHGKELREFYKAANSKLVKLNRLVMAWHANTEREARRIERERMRRLMAEDEKGYRELIDKKKDQRLHYLLEQTDQFTAKLSKLVKVHKRKQKSQRHKERRLKQREIQDGLAKVWLERAVEDPTIRVPVLNPSTGERLTDDNGPLARDLEAWLADHPGWWVIPVNEAGVLCPEELEDQYQQQSAAAAAAAADADDDSSGTSDDEAIDDAVKGTEDDDYHQQQGYYGTAHSIQERVREQASIMVNGKLKEYQLKGLQWLVSLYNNNLNGILADEMGLGKTIQTIALITYLMEKKKENGPYLIIVPLSTMSNWSLEFDKWAPSVKKVLYKGSPQMRRQLQQTELRSAKFNVLLTTYEYIMKDKSVLTKINWRYMIIDEGHRMKNHHCKLTCVLNTYFTAPYRLLLTGTPLQNKLPELWALMNFLLPSVFSSVTTFEQWFNAPFALSGAEKVELNQEETLLIIRRLHKVLRPFLLRRLKKEVESQLPDKVEYVIKCDMSALQRTLYHHMSQRNVILTDGSGKEKKGNGGVKTLNNTIMQLRKICNHPYLFPHIEDAMTEHKGHHAVNGEDLYRSCGKFELLNRILPKLRATGHRVLIFCQMTQLMTIMQDYFDYMGYKYLRLDGTTKSEDRGSLLQIFSDKESDYFIFLLSTRAGGLGLNLQAADTVILFDSDWNPHQDLQAQDRAHRIGQKNEVRVLRLICVNSVEERILAAARYKLNVDEKVIQAGMFDQKSTGVQRREFLMALLEEEQDGDDEGLEVHDDETINQMLARTEEEFKIYQRMDKERPSDRPRLLSQDELPAWISRVEEETANSSLMDDGEDSESCSGFGKRQRKEVDYTDSLTDQQFIRAIQEGTLYEMEDQMRHRKKMRRALASEDSLQMSQSQASLVSEAAAGSTPGYSGDVSVSSSRGGGGRGGGRGRKKKSASSHHRPAAATAASPQLIAHLQRLLQPVLRYRDPADNRPLADPFVRLPSRRDLPDYYEVIRRPLDFARIRQRIRDGRYASVDELDAEVRQLFENARTYNSDGSLIFQDSLVLQRVWEETRQSLAAEEEELGASALDDASADDSALASPEPGSSTRKRPRSSTSRRSASNGASLGRGAKRRRAAQQLPPPPTFFVNDEEDEEEEAAADEAKEEEELEVQEGDPEEANTPAAASNLVDNDDTPEAEPEAVANEERADAAAEIEAEPPEAEAEAEAALPIQEEANLDEEQEEIEAEHLEQTAETEVNADVEPEPEPEANNNFEDGELFLGAE